YFVRKDKHGFEIVKTGPEIFQPGSLPTGLSRARAGRHGRPERTGNGGNGDRAQTGGIMIRTQQESARSQNLPGMR
ncbi:MAG: hypothetical protein DRH56_06185, partial [Deltaproteobacteria bacterium]